MVDFHPRIDPKVSRLKMVLATAFAFCSLLQLAAILHCDMDTSALFCAAVTSRPAAFAPITSYRNQSLRVFLAIACFTGRNASYSQATSR
jgi:hypothetical protein